MPALHQKLELLPGSDKLSTFCPLLTSFIIPSILLLSKQQRWNLMGLCLQIKWSWSLSHDLESISFEKNPKLDQAVCKRNGKHQSALPACPQQSGERITEWSGVFKYCTALVFSIFMLRDLVKSHGLAKWSGGWGRLWKCTFCLFHELCIVCAARLQNFVSHMK